MSDNVFNAIGFMLDKGIEDPERRSQLQSQLDLLRQIPGGLQLLQTKLSGKDPFKPPQAEARGGLSQGAKAFKQQGRGGDTQLVHMSPEELGGLQAMWGEPTINPETGLPEYFGLGDIFDGIKDAVTGIGDAIADVFESPVFQAVAPIALNIVAPGLGTALGSALGAGAAWAPVVGNALIGGGISTLGGGNPIQGAITGGIAGGGGQMLGNTMGFSGNTANLVGSAAAGALGSTVTGGNPLQGAIQSGLGAAAQNYMSTPGVAGNLELEGPPAPEGLSGGLGQATTGAATSGKSDWFDTAMKGASVLSALSPPQQPEQPVFDPHASGNWGGPLPELTFERTMITPEEVEEYYSTYGQTGATLPSERDFYQSNYLPVAAQGGYFSQGRFYRGSGSGRDDLIDAKLSDGEYVIDAETVALLGDGSSDTGARRLDEMRKNLRMHKAKQMSKGRFSPNAKRPEKYMARGGKVSRDLTPSQLVDIMAQEKQK